jgi:hypothetical protein
VTFTKNFPTKLLLVVLSFIVLAGYSIANPPQQQISGGGSTSIVQGGNTALVSAGGALKVDGSAVTQPVSGTVTITPSGTQTVTGAGGTFPITGSVGISGGTANIGLVRIIPSACTQSTPFNNSTVGVAVGAGTTVTSTTTCVTFAYVNNITNSPVTLRLADKAGTPVIWFGGGADYMVPANSNIRIPIDGVTFTSGITAIAGTAAALNLQINGLQ